MHLPLLRHRVFSEINILTLKPARIPRSFVREIRSGNVVEVVDIDEMLRKLSKVSDNISTLAESLNESFGTEEAKRSLKAAVLNLGEMTENLNRTIATNDQKMQIVLENVNKLTASLNEFVDKNKEPLTEAVGNLRRILCSNEEGRP